MNRQDFPAPPEGFVVTHMLIVEDIGRSVDFYVNSLGASELVRIPDGPAILGFANTWIIINVGGGPTEDKPTVVLAPPSDPDLIDSFMNIRVADVHAIYDEWSAAGARFLTPPQDRGAEIRCYVRDPDGYLIEVGQSTGALG
ncbi:MAG: VOC family protein [Thermoleophilia bacterium]|nr:VOC family protein [Thermoleophilia bacterium]